MSLLFMMGRAHARGGKRSAVGLALVALLTGSCFDIHGCDSFDSCNGDSDCAFNQICDVGWLGKSCLAAHECATDWDCATGETCLRRPDAPATNPFESDSPGKMVCVCDNGYFCQCDEGNCGTTSTSAGTGGVGGSGGIGGSGGTGPTGGAGGTGGTGATGGAAPDGGTEAGVDAGTGGSP